MQVRSLGGEESLEEGVATHSSILAWRIPWTEEPGGLQSMGSWRVWHDWRDLSIHSMPTGVAPSSHCSRDASKWKRHSSHTQEGTNRDHAAAMLKKPDTQPQAVKPREVEWGAFHFLRSHFFLSTRSWVFPWLYHSIGHRGLGVGTPRPLTWPRRLTQFPARPETRRRDSEFCFCFACDCTFPSSNGVFQSGHSHCFKGWNLWFESNGCQPHKMSFNITTDILTIGQIPKTPMKSELP